MRFCPKCGTMLEPVKRNKKTILRCPRCGYEEVVKSTKSSEYKLVVKSGKENKVKTTSLVSEGKVTSRKKEEIEQEKEEFYEVFLDLMSEEEGS
ncbi:MAG: zf-TFIIB domain-containing protein [Desulfurococcales archaeon]|nr:zf-TFIIB domain-containing protein [Desulfurococcales archaeon]MCD6278712.1 zf-TFIIB domain-containing protein [Desulfurococcales archaeon]